METGEYGRRAASSGDGNGKTELSWLIGSYGPGECKERETYENQNCTELRQELWLLYVSEHTEHIICNSLFIY